MSEGLTMNQLAERNALLVTENAALQQKLDIAERACAAYFHQEISLRRKLDALAAENAALKGVFGPGEAVLNFLTIALRHTTYDEIDLNDVSLAFQMSLPETPSTDAYLNSVRADAKAEGVEEYAESLSHQALKMRELDQPRIRVASVNAESTRAREFAAQLRAGQDGE